METLTELIEALNGFVWGPYMLVLILGTGFFLMLGLKLMPLARMGYGFRMLWRGRHEMGEGDITPFNALMTSLSATIGTGNIAGVATAIFMGGPGALFWMWCTALVGMATKYAEAVLAVKYREVDEENNHIGGPMFYIKNGLGSKWVWLGGVFAVFGALAGFGIGNTVQANSVAGAITQMLSFPDWMVAAMSAVINGLALEVAPDKALVGLFIAMLTGLVLIGGIRWIAQVAGKLVPFMAIVYVCSGLVILLLHAAEIPSALSLIITHAFTPTAATGGFAGAGVWMAIRYGVARGVFSNEAGLGSAPIAHAAAETDSPVRQGTVAMLGTFIDTIIVCSITGLVIVISGAWTGGENGAALSSAAFEQALPGFGGYVVTFGLSLFAFTTLLGWSVYGEKCVEYLFGVKSIVPFRVLWIIAIPVGATAELTFTWLVADTLNALMALPNLLALLLLSPVVFRLTRDYFADKDSRD